MVLAYHIIFAAYGFWLPNDPRGSWSEFVASWELLLAGGKATTTGASKSSAHQDHDIQKRLDAKRSLKFDPVEFTGVQARAVANGFHQAIQQGAYLIYACSILPSHVHLVMGRVERNIKTVVGHLKSKASHRLRSENLHPFEGHAHDDGSVPTCWAEGCWKVYLDSPEAIRRAIDYVEENPVKEGRPRQRWSFVAAFGQ